MSKGAYIGIDGVARKVKDIYIGVDGVARKIKAGYIGVNGVARPCWAGGATGDGSLDGMRSYNGVLLPTLPEWDKEKYPYVVIKRDNSSSDTGVWREDHMFTAFFLTEPCAFKEGTLFTNATLQFTSNGN